MDFFASSTHAHSLLSPPQVDEARLALHNSCIHQLPEGTPWLSPQEADLIRHYYQAKISDVCSYLKLPKFIQPVAHWLYMRYHLHQTLLKYDLKHVMFTCILVATKMENLHLTASDFTLKIPNCQPSLIPEIELALLQALQFNLAFFHPHSALQGLALALHADKARLVEAGKILDKLITTDALLTQTPSHLALAAFSYVAPDLVDTFIQTKLKDLVDLDELSTKIASIKEFILLKTPIDTARLKEIDRKLFQARSALSTANK